MAGIYDRFGIPTVVNGCGPVTRLGGSPLNAAVTEAMAQAAQACVDMFALQAGASRVIARVTGAEAGCVTSGASAAMLLGAAACLAGLDAARMNALPDVADGRCEILVVRSQRNMYDRALIVAGGQIKEIGIPDRFSGPGVRDAAAWEIEAAIDARTACVYYLAQSQSRPALMEIAAAAHARGVPVLVDAAAQLPPADNLHRFLEEGADLVAFSGGKAIGGPQASGILCGRADLVASAVIQMLDLDFEPEGWSPPEEFAALRTLRGLPHHGIGRSCKAGKEEVIGLLVALERFAAEASATRTAHWRAVLQAVLDAAAIPALRIIEDPDRPDVPLLALSSAAAPQIAARLAAGTPPIHCRVDVQRLLLSPLSLSPDDAALIGARLRAAIAA